METGSKRQVCEKAASWPESANALPQASNFSLREKTLSYFFIHEILVARDAISSSRHIH